jgi:polygalacturonase
LNNIKNSSSNLQKSIDVAVMIHVYWSYCTVGCGDCKGASWSNSNFKNIFFRDADMTEDM